MRARDVVGRRIIGVRQTRIRDKCAKIVMHIDALVLDNGDEIHFNVAELGWDYAVESWIKRREL